MTFSVGITSVENGFVLCTILSLNPLFLTFKMARYLTDDHCVFLKMKTYRMRKCVKTSYAIINKTRTS